MPGFNVEKLNEREKQCLYSALADKTMRETAESLCLSLETVRTYRKTILRKLGCNTIAGALSVAMRTGLIEWNLVENG